MKPLSSSPRPLDVLAIGCGPFNLGLAALGSGLPGLRMATVDARDELRWHPGLMIDDARLQVGFLADLVSLVDPTHPLSFLAYLRDVDRMYPFYVRERFHMTREEYQDYLRWAARRLPTVHFGRRVERVERSEDGQAFHVDIASVDGTEQVCARHLVLGIGTEAWAPDCVRDLDPSYWLHSGDYLHRRDDIARARRVTVVGSGQSGAEVVLDLLRHRDGPHVGVSWLTRTCAFAPLDYTKLVLEMTTPEYVTYFHGLPRATRDALVAGQWRHYKGISSETLEEIHDLLYRGAVRHGHPDVELRHGVEIEACDPIPEGIRMRCRHRESGQILCHDTDLIIAATGYRPRSPSFLEPVMNELSRDELGRFVVDIDHAIVGDGPPTGRIFVANADTHSHGVAAPDLGIGAYRNARILNAVMGREVHRLPRRTAFTSFDPSLAPRRKAS
ncbi:MAG: SidA/IucD/PvdA family monooxygenase [Myxococcota bacterium]